MKTHVCHGSISRQQQLRLFNFAYKTASLSDHNLLTLVPTEPPFLMARPQYATITLVLILLLGAAEAKCGGTGTAFFNAENETKQGYGGELYAAVRCHITKELCDSESLPPQARGEHADDRSKLSR